MTKTTRADHFRNVVSTLVRNQYILTILVVVVAIGMFAGTAKGATYTWDGGNTSNGTADGGDGTWDASTTANWWNGAGDVVWTASNAAVFGGTAGTVTVDPAGVKVGNITFATTGYTIQGGPITFAAAATINLATAISGTISSNLTSAFNVLKTGAGTLTLSGTNSFATLGATTAGTTDLGTIIVTGGSTGVLGALIVASANSGTVTGRFIQSGGTVTVGGNILVGSSTTGANGGYTLTGGLLSGGLLAITNSSPTTGFFIMTGGTANFSGIQTNNSTSSINSTLTLSGGVLNLGATGITAAGNASTRSYQFGDATIGAFANWTDSSPSAFTLTGTNTGTVFNTLDSVDGVTARTITMGALSGAGLLVKTGSGTLILTAANTNTGATAINGGTIQLNNASALQDSVTSINVASGLAFSNTASSGSTYTLGGLSGASNLALTDTGANAIALKVGNNNNTGMTYSGTLSGSGNLTKLGTGVQTLSGTNTYTGVTAVSGGTLEFAQEASLYTGGSASWTAANLTVSSGATAAFKVGGTGEFTAADLDLLKGLGTSTGGFLGGSLVGIDTTDAGGSFTYGSAIGNTNSGANALGVAKLGAGTLTLTGSNTYTGNTVIAGGTLAIGGAGTLGVGGTYAGTIANSGALAISTSAAAQTLSGIISGTGALTMSGSGTLTASGNNTFTGAVNVNSGTLTSAAASTAGNSFLGGPGTSASHRVVNIAAGAQISYTNTTVNEFLALGATPSSGGYGSFYDFTISGTLAINDGAAVSQILDSTYNLQNGGVITNTGVAHTGLFGLLFGWTAGGSGNINVTGTGNQITADRIGFFNGATITTNPGAILTITSIIKDGSSTASSLIKAGAGTLFVTGTNTYTGTTTISGGAVVAATNAPASAVGAFGNASSAIVLGDTNTASNNSSPSLLTGGAFTIGRAVTIANQATSGTYSIGGATDNNSVFSGVITANQPLSITQAATTGSHALTISNAIVSGTAGTQTINFANTGAVIVSGSIGSGPGTLAVTQSGPGVTTLSGLDTYAGATNVNGGTLIVSGSLSGSQVNVGGGTLAGTGTIGSLVTVGNGLGAPGSSIIAPSAGAATSGTSGLTINNSLALNSDGEFKFALNSDGPFTGTAPNIFGVSDYLTMSGSMNILTGALLSGLDAGNTALPLGDKYLIAFAGNGITGTFANVPQDGIIQVGQNYFSVDYGAFGGDGLVLTTAVPEPGTCGAIVIGAAMLLGLRRKRRRA